MYMMSMNCYLATVTLTDKEDSMGDYGRHYIIFLISLFFQLKGIISTYGLKRFYTVIQFAKFHFYSSW